jgi:hypothetical protein
VYFIRSPCYYFTFCKVNCLDKIIMVKICHDTKFLSPTLIGVRLDPISKIGWTLMMVHTQLLHLQQDELGVV